MHRLRVHWAIGDHLACHTRAATKRRTKDPQRVTCELCLRLLRERLPIVRDEDHLRMDRDVGS